jgi:uncharacterized membrane protein YcaP (DUF421 family)
MFSTEAATLLEIVARVAIVYVALLAMLRLAGRRALSDITPMDMMVLLLVSETVSPALTAGDESLTGGLVAAATLIALSVLASVISFRSRRFERVVGGQPETLIRDGKVDAEMMRRHRITDDDLRTALHEGGVLAVDEVRRAFVEADGQIVIVKREG